MPQPIFCTGSYYQTPIPVLRPNPYSLSHRLNVTIIFQTAPPEPAENQRLLVNFHVQGHSWRLGRANCKVKSDFVNYSINCLPKYKHVRSLSDTLMFAEGWETCYRASSKPSLLEIQLMDRWGIQTANTISDAAESYPQKQRATRAGKKPQLWCAK